MESAPTPRSRQAGRVAGCDATGLASGGDVSRRSLVAGVARSVAARSHWVARPRRRAAVPAGSATEACRPSTSVTALLRGWDARRSAAYAAADVAALRRLYADGSIAGRRDVAVLRSYRSRGLRVVGLTTPAARRAERAQHAGEVVLRVTDRLAGAVAVGPGRRVRLPAGTARTRVVTLVDEGRGWVVAEVRAGAAG